MDIMILTGMSGAGKTVVGTLLEDYGYYCIDNIPVPLLMQFIDLYLREERKSRKIAFVVDVRGCDDFSELLSLIHLIKETKDHNASLMFLDCDDDTIINRYKESRHIHPLVLSNHYTLTVAIEAERKMLASCKETADYVIDTTNLTTTACREHILALLTADETPSMNVSITSFGFKYGTPPDADLMFDVRCFPNPYYVAELKHKTGLTHEVADYVLQSTEIQVFLDNLCRLLNHLLPLYHLDGRSHVTIAIGCTGGKHRSVTVAERLCVHLNQTHTFKTTVSHRDIEK